MCPYHIWTHIIHFIFLLFTLKFSYLSALPPLNEDSFCTAHFFLNIYNFCFLWLQIVLLGPIFRRTGCCVLVLCPVRGRVPYSVSRFGSYCGWSSLGKPKVTAQKPLRQRPPLLRGSLRQASKGWWAEQEKVDMEIIFDSVSTHLVKLYTFHGP